MGERERKKRERGWGDNLFRRGINYSGIDYPGDNLLWWIIYIVTPAHMAACHNHFRPETICSSNCTVQISLVPGPVFNKSCFRPANL